MANVYVVDWSKAIFNPFASIYSVQLLWEHDGKRNSAFRNLIDESYTRALFKFSDEENISINEIALVRLGTIGRDLIDIPVSAKDWIINSDHEYELNIKGTY